MENITMRKQGQKLIVEIDLSKEGRPSTSGKSLLIATTSGNAQVPDAKDTFIGVNVYRKGAQVEA